jgi:hypothetical protein
MICPYCRGRRVRCAPCGGFRVLTGPCVSLDEQKRQDRIVAWIGTLPRETSSPTGSKSGCEGVK